MMERVLAGLSLASVSRGRFARNDDDLTDRLSHRYTTFLLCAFAVLVTTKTYSGDPINCWCPAYFTGNYIDYTNKICWVSNTYHVPLNALTLPSQPDPGEMINYYQWVPLILLLQALLFQLPCTIWQGLNSKAGLDIGGLVEAASSIQSLEQNQDTEKIMNHMIRQVTDYLSAAPEVRCGRLARTRELVARNVFWLCGRTYGTYLSGAYLVVKLLYVLNAVGQIVLLNAFIRRDYRIYGLEVLQELLGYRELGINLRFPRVTWCDFSVRQLKTVHRHTVQCVLPINLFNEKIFIFLWFWLVFVAILSVFSLLLWLFRCIFYYDRVDYIKVHLKQCCLLDSTQRGAEVRRLVRTFTLHYLKPDGVLLLRLLEHNTSQLITLHLLAALWSRFRTSHLLEEEEAGEKQALHT